MNLYIIVQFKNGPYTDEDKVADCQVSISSDHNRKTSPKNTSAAKFLRKHTFSADQFEHQKKITLLNCACHEPSRKSNTKYCEPYIAVNSNAFSKVEELSTQRSHVRSVLDLIIAHYDI